MLSVSGKSESVNERTRTDQQKGFLGDSLGTTAELRKCEDGEDVLLKN